jgi:hypothetical protein
MLKYRIKLTVVHVMRYFPAFMKSQNFFILSQLNLMSILQSDSFKISFNSPINFWVFQVFYFLIYTA